MRLNSRHLNIGITLLLVTLTVVFAALTSLADTRGIIISQDGQLNVNVSVDPSLIPDAQIHRHPDKMVIELPHKAFPNGFKPGTLRVDSKTRSMVKIGRNDSATTVTITSKKIFLSIQDLSALSTTPKKKKPTAKAVTAAVSAQKKMPNIKSPQAKIAEAKASKAVTKTKVETLKQKASKWLDIPVPKLSRTTGKKTTTTAKATPKPTTQKPAAKPKSVAPPPKKPVTAKAPVIPNAPSVPKAPLIINIPSANQQSTAKQQPQIISSTPKPAAPTLELDAGLKQQSVKDSAQKPEKAAEDTTKTTKEKPDETPKEPESTQNEAVPEPDAESDDAVALDNTMNDDELASELGYDNLQELTLMALEEDIDLNRYQSAALTEGETGIPLDALMKNPENSITSGETITRIILSLLFVLLLIGGFFKYLLPKLMERYPEFFKNRQRAYEQKLAESGVDSVPLGLASIGFKPKADSQDVPQEQIEDYPDEYAFDNTPSAVPEDVAADEPEITKEITGEDQEEHAFPAAEEATLPPPVAETQPMQEAPPEPQVAPTPARLPEKIQEYHTPPQPDQKGPGKLKVTMPSMPKLSIPKVHLSPKVKLWNPFPALFGMTNKLAQDYQDFRQTKKAERNRLYEAQLKQLNPDFNCLATREVGRGRAIHLVELWDRHMVVATTPKAISLLGALGEKGEDLYFEDMTNDNGKLISDLLGDGQTIVGLFKNEFLLGSPIDNDIHMATQSDSKLVLEDLYQKYLPEEEAAATASKRETPPATKPEPPTKRLVPDSVAQRQHQQVNPTPTPTSTSSSPASSMEPRIRPKMTPSTPPVNQPVFQKLANSPIMQPPKEPAKEPAAEPQPKLAPESTMQLPPADAARAREKQAQIRQEVEQFVSKALTPKQPVHPYQAEEIVVLQDYDDEF